LRVLHCIASFPEFHAWHIFFIRIDAETEVVYELVAEPIQELQVGEPQAAEAAEHATVEVANPADLQGKPRSISLILITPCYI